MQRNAHKLLRRLRTSSLDKVARHVTRAHRLLENDQLTNLQQAFIRLPYTIDPSALILFDEISLALQDFVRELLQHYILEEDVYGECHHSLGTSRIDKATSNRLRYQHQSLQESLSDLQSLTNHLTEVAGTADAHRFHRLLDELADNLHEQILAEDKVLLPRSSLN
ncbi:hemerythrin domain-containing protein [Pelagicoccus sp. NFK12]|uniref:Hemerythrin domain-containing protein n=1 Tax=Pelagicoccus enzymogenes TaxID=2773457 RepID=A0A927IHF4_9BACT|nr:hemerythrin domain-containing protein [Pelagicoccus enzymogenes]MBD5779774.1 hemerythrin domain-containing protein [Pelagicoccus enzymogenes]MDQ8200291.1 hemerythrin domain-containing protein [Pelagicoccus enzymogenes]